MLPVLFGGMAVESLINSWAGRAVETHEVNRTLSVCNEHAVGPGSPAQVVHAQSQEAIAPHSNTRWLTNPLEKTRTNRWIG
jgi:hypothetical protein